MAQGGTMSLKRTMTLNLTVAEMDVLAALSEKKDVSKTALLRRALRMYQEIDARLESGNKLLIEDERTNNRAELMIL